MSRNTKKRKNKKSLRTIPSDQGRRRKRFTDETHRRDSKVVDARKNKRTAFDLSYKLLVKAVNGSEQSLHIDDFDKIRKKHIHQGKTTDALMYNAMNRFNQKDSISAGVYAHYRKKEKRVVFTSIDGEYTHYTTKAGILCRLFLL